MTPTELTELDRCEHKWVHLRKEESEEISYRRWATVDRYFCEKCLEQRLIKEEIKEKHRYY